MNATYQVRDGETREAAYRRMAGEMNLFGVAFFGHRCATARQTHNARRRLEYAWRQVLRQLPPN